MRTWSAGNLDLPVRPSDQGLSRQDGVLRDKRRSVSGLLRRDSSGIIDPQGDNWSGGSRDNGPMVSKWEQLALAPELLRSLVKFGVGPPNKIQQRALPFLLKGADIIAQAPPTQERIAAYVIPAIQVAVTHLNTHSNRGPIVVMISTTVDQATQAQRMIRDLGGPIGVKSALGVGTTSVGHDLAQELRLLQQNMPHIICGTPQKLHTLFTSPGGLIGTEVRFLVLDEVDQLIARNLHEFVFNIVKLLPPPRSRPLSSNAANSTNATAGLPGPTSQTTFTSPFEPGNPVISSFPVPSNNSGRRFSAAVPSPNPVDPTTPTPTASQAAQPIERQTALFSNTVPQDVLNLASTIQLREPVRVLVRRDGNVANPEVSQGSRGLRQFYLYLAFTAGGRSDPMASTAGGGLGIIGSGRSASNAETTQAREWKLDALADIFDDVEVNQAIVYVGGMTALDSVIYKLASRGLEAIPLHGDMNAVTRVAALNKFRSSSSVILKQPTTKVLVIYDVQLKTNEVPHVPLVINYDLPKAVEEYSNRVSAAIASAYSRAGVVVNFVTATGGDVEMLRSIECYYK
ncbi:P-loop containing nucleoside triphosphate hydrolase protein [Gymnopilus junonius]|uniref:RNA helicase n=1 Tax=Gymnopilus junonius TaxID=109634 RepID=A0A9P5P1G6_GYMJU|nr:P-loop containing nucleoside triphosphate hydrolase protein [Gymnopilus junonius]